MSDASTSLSARLVRAALAIAPGSWNPAWRCGDSVRAILGEGARIKVDPRQVEGKVRAPVMAGLKSRFLVPGLGAEAQPISALHTYRDVEDFDAHGDDFRATRLFQWLKQAADAGRPINARGVVCDSEERMLDYYRTYLELFRSLKIKGYDYRGPDEICFGVTASGGIVHMRRGTHRLASAHFLGLPSVTGYLTHADPAWVEGCRRNGGSGPFEAIALSLRAIDTRAKVS